MAVSSLLPATTTNTAATQQEQSGGIIPADYKVPSMPAVTSGAQNYEIRMDATESLMKAGNGNLAGGGFHRRRNNVTKVMKGCSNKKTIRNNKKKRHNKRLFRGGASITPEVVDGKIELPVPGGASAGQVGTLKELTGGLFDAQTVAANKPPTIMPPIVVSNFSGGGISRRRHRRTKYRRLRYKKSIGRRGRSRRHSGRH
jgi:hypothetical protein